MAKNTTELTDEQRAVIAELIGNARPATDQLLLEMAQQIRDRREHDHSTGADWDWYCLNASGWLGDKAPTVLRRLLDAEARVAELESRGARYRIAWGMARTRAISTGGAADRYAARARDAQEALQHMLFTVIAGQMALKAATDRVAELEQYQKNQADNFEVQAALIRQAEARVAELEARIEAEECRCPEPAPLCEGCRCRCHLQETDFAPVPAGEQGAGQ